MVKYYRTLAMISLMVVAYISWYFGLYVESSAMYIANQYVPLGQYLAWGFFFGSLVLLFDILTTGVYRVHRLMCPVRSITLFSLSVGWAGHIMLSPNKWVIIIPCSVSSLCCLGLAIADGVRKNKKMTGVEGD